MACAAGDVREQLRCVSPADAERSHGLSIYGASKAALEAVSESLAEELRPLGIHVTIVQRGRFRTGFVASLERAAAQFPEYDGTSGKFLRLLESSDGRQAGDPREAAEAVIAAAQASNPPRYLLLGKSANDKLRKAHDDAERERAAWESVALPTGFAPRT